MSDYKTTSTEKKKEAKRRMSGEQLSKCTTIIHTASTAAFLSGVLPIPVVDAIPITAAQVTMVLSLGKVFGREITESAAKSAIAAAMATFVGRNLIKWIPIVGWGISGFVAAGITEAIGWTIAVDLIADQKKNEQYKTTSGKAEEHHDVKKKPDGNPTDSEPNNQDPNSRDMLIQRADRIINMEKPKDPAELKRLSEEYKAVRDAIEKMSMEDPEDYELRSRLAKLNGMDL